MEGNCGQTLVEQEETFENSMTEPSAKPFTLVRLLGSGHFAEVWLGIADSMEVAIKMVKFKKVTF